IVFTREPGGSNIAEQIRKIVLDGANMEMDVLCEAFLYSASRIQHLHDIVIPALNSGKVVVCDRYVDSSYAYQGVARGLGLEKIRHLNAIAVGEYMPEYTLFLDLSPKQAFARKGGVDMNDRLENVNEEFHNKVYQAFCSLAQQEKERYIVIDASGSVMETQQKIRDALRDRGVIK
ncbi:MAG: dTMP kinase, partial [Clostridia bacterium]